MKWPWKGKERNEHNIPISKRSISKRRCIRGSASKPLVRIRPARTILLHPWYIGPLSSNLQNVHSKMEVKNENADII